VKGTERTRGSLLLSSGIAPEKRGAALAEGACTKISMHSFSCCFQALIVSWMSLVKAACTQSLSCSSAHILQQAVSWEGIVLRTRPPDEKQRVKSCSSVVHGHEMMQRHTSFCLRRAEPADLMVFPVASFADCLPPAFALHECHHCQTGATLSR